MALDRMIDLPKQHVPSWIDHRPIALWPGGPKRLLHRCDPFQPLGFRNSNHIALIAGWAKARPHECGQPGQAPLPTLHMIGFMESVVEGLCGRSPRPVHKATYTHKGTAVASFMPGLPEGRGRALFVAMAASVSTADRKLHRSPCIPRSSGP